MLSIAEISKLLVDCLIPILPLLNKVGESIVVKVGADTVSSVGNASLNKAKSIWAKISPMIQKTESAQQVISDVIQHSSDAAYAEMAREIQGILESDPELVQDLLKLLKEKDYNDDNLAWQPYVVQSGGVSIKGDFDNKNGTFVGGNQVNLGRQ